jgi:hypothetical protein
MNGAWQQEGKKCIRAALARIDDLQRCALTFRRLPSIDVINARPRSTRVRMRAVRIARAANVSPSEMPLNALMGSRRCWRRFAEFHALEEKNGWDRAIWLVLHRREKCAARALSRRASGLPMGHPPFFFSQLF